MQQKEHGWVGNRMKERALARELHRGLPHDFSRFDELFDLVKARNEYR
jgi:type I restriction enzyme R subunit